MRTRLRFPLVCTLFVFAVSCLVVVRADTTPARIYLEAGDSLFGQWRFRDALVMYGNAERVAQGQERLRASLGVTAAAVRIGEFDLALAKGSRLLEQFPEEPRVQAGYGEAAWAAGLFEEARDAFTRCLSADAANVRARLGLARVLVASNHLGEALENAMAAFANAPDEADAHYMIGSISSRTGQLSRAIQFFTSYLTLVPETETYRREWVRGEIVLLRSFGRQVPMQTDRRALERPFTLPFRLVNQKIVIPLRLNGRDYEDFVLDTGAERTVLSESTARRLNIVAVSRTRSAGIGNVGLRGLQNARLNSLQIGPLVVRHVPCLIKSPGLYTSGVMPEANGFSPLSMGLSVRIDYKAHQLTFARNLPDEPERVEMPLWFYRLATVRGLVNGDHPASFIVDTGGQLISIGADTARTLEPTGVRNVPIRVFGASGLDLGAYLRPGVSLDFDTLALETAPVAVINLRVPSLLLGYRIGGIIGHHFLSNYKVSIDLQRQVLGLSPQQGS